MRWDDLTYTVKAKVKENPRQYVMISLLVLVGIVAVATLGRVVVPAPEAQPDVQGLQDQRTRDDRRRVESAQEERRAEAERLRREAQAQGEDPDADSKRPGGG